VFSSDVLKNAEKKGLKVCVSGNKRERRGADSVCLFFSEVSRCVSLDTDSLRIKLIDRIRKYHRKDENDELHIYLLVTVWNRGKLREFATETKPLRTNKTSERKRRRRRRARKNTHSDRGREREIILVRGLQIRS
jgi:hypothetical protein